MRKCPYCLSEVKNEAKKCKYCGEWLVNENDIVSKQNNSHNFKIISVIVIGCLVIALILSRIYFTNGEKSDNVSESKDLHETLNIDNNKNNDSLSFQKNLDCQNYLDTYKGKYKDYEMVGIFYSPKEDACLGYVYYVSYGYDGEEFYNFIIEDPFDDRRSRFSYYEYQYYPQGEPYCYINSDYEGTKREFSPCKPQYIISTDLQSEWEAEIERLKKG